MAVISNRGHCYFRIVKGTVNSEVYIALMCDFTNELRTLDKDYQDNHVVISDRFSGHVTPKSR